MVVEGMSNANALSLFARYLHIDTLIALAIKLGDSSLLQIHGKCRKCMQDWRQTCDSILSSRKSFICVDSPLEYVLLSMVYVMCYMFYVWIVLVFFNHRSPFLMDCVGFEDLLLYSNVVPTYFLLLFVWQLDLNPHCRHTNMINISDSLRLLL